MTSREKGFCFELARFMCYPNSIEIGGASSQLKDIIREITEGRLLIRKQVFEFCEEFVVDGKYDLDAYNTFDCEEVLNEIKEDYDKVFF